MERIVIVGSSGHAKVIIGIVEAEGRFEISGLLDRFRSVGEATLGYPVIGKEEELPQFQSEFGLRGVVIGVGDNFLRSKVAARVEELCPDLPLLTAVHPSAIIARDVVVGRGSVIMPGVVVNSGCRIGDLCVLNTVSSLDHDSTMEDFSSLGPRVATGGRCRIGRYSAIGIGAVVSNGIVVGEHTVIGAGATVIRDVPASCVAYGTPARPVRNRVAGENYL